MKEINIREVMKYVNENIISFHSNKLKTLRTIDLHRLLKSKNPYLFKAKNILTAEELVRVFLEATLSSSEEKIFGDFLENLAVFISSKTCDGRKSAARGVDLEFVKGQTQYLVSIKSGPSWGNSSQQKRQEQDFQEAIRILKQSKHTADVRAVLGICYGKTRTSHVRGYLKVTGQNFWYFISENKDLYKDIIEPLGYRAKQHNEAFQKEKAKLINEFSVGILKNFCTKEHELDWKKIVEFNSGNLDLVD